MVVPYFGLAKVIFKHILETLAKSFWHNYTLYKTDSNKFFIMSMTKHGNFKIFCLIIRFII
jgi:hypothetical protein